MNYSRRRLHGGGMPGRFPSFYIVPHTYISGCSESIVEGGELPRLPASHVVNASELGPELEHPDEEENLRRGARCEV